MVSGVVFVTPPKAAEMVAIVFALTAEVVTLKVPVVLPAAIVTVPGTVAAAWLDERAIASPPAGAAEPIVTVPCEVLPPLIKLGATVNDFRIGG